MFPPYSVRRTLNRSSHTHTHGEHHGCRRVGHPSRLVESLLRRPIDEYAGIVFFFTPTSLRHTRNGTLFDFSPFYVLSHGWRRRGRYIKGERERTQQGEFDRSTLVPSVLLASLSPHTASALERQAGIGRARRVLEELRARVGAAGRARGTRATSIGSAVEVELWICRAGQEHFFLGVVGQYSGIFSPLFPAAPQAPRARPGAWENFLTNSTDF